MSRVNPPPFLKMPREFSNDKDKRSYFEKLEFNFFQVWKRTGGGEDAIALADEYRPQSSSRLADLEQRIGSGDFVTGDTTSFTGDTIKIYGDRTET